MRILLFGCVLLIWIVSCKSPQSVVLDDSPSENIRINQIGYYPTANKKAVILSGLPHTDFYIVDYNSQKVKYKGKTSDVFFWTLAQDSVVIADFTRWDEPGEYVIFTKESGTSYHFTIAENILEEPLQASVKSYYYQRAGMTITEEFGGQWNRPAGHLDDNVLFHPSTGRAGSISSRKGWYDAGDYGKYVVNGAFSLGQMLFLPEEYPELLKDESLHLPESGNGVPDILDELKWEMDWLLTMQDKDGGVFFKLTSLSFSGMKLPHQINKPRYIIGKSTSATLDFAAVAAKMSRIYRPYDVNYADQCLKAAIKAWSWAQINRYVVFTNPEDVKTGEYSDTDFSQEWYWTAVELYAATTDEKFINVLNNVPNFHFKENESWANFMHFLGAFTIVENELPNHELVKSEIIEVADSLILVIDVNDYLQPISVFPWGSNSDVMNAAMILMHAYRWTNQVKYKIGATYCIDYIFGRNGLGYSFMTGYGDKTPMHLHHRPSAGDGIDQPIPGFLSGGPNHGKHDAHNVEYKYGDIPMKCWEDNQKSFASNEVCLNWNAPLTYVLGALQASQ